MTKVAELSVLASLCLGCKPILTEKVHSMFCYQCEQTSKGEGCQTIGVCGKDETTSTLQDLLIHVVKGIAM